MLFNKSVCCIIIFALVVCAASALMAEQKIQFDKESIDFGKVISGNPINAVFTFKNTGDTDLDITNVKAGCGCTSAKARKNKIAPGEESAIDATFHSSGYNGHINKSITVTTNDPTRGSVNLSIMADIVALAKLKPERLNFGSIKINNNRTHLLLVYPGDPKTFTITKIEPHGTHVTVPSFKKVTNEAGDYWQLTVLVKAYGNPGRIMENFDILTGPEPKDKVNVLVYGNTVE